MYFFEGDKGVLGDDLPTTRSACRGPQLPQTAFMCSTRFAHLQGKRPFQSPFWGNKVHSFAQIPVVQSVLNRCCASLLVVCTCTGRAVHTRYVHGAMCKPTNAQTMCGCTGPAKLADRLIQSATHDCSHAEGSSRGGISIQSPKRPQYVDYPQDGLIS
jgi:hypothetical protein